MMLFIAASKISFCLLERFKKIYSRYSARNEALRPAVYRDTRGREHRSDAAMRGYNFFENALISPATSASTHLVIVALLTSCMSLILEKSNGCSTPF